MPRRLARRLVLETSCHATEDAEKVRSALLSILPEDLRRRSRIVETVYRGHYGNPIRLLRIELRGDDADAAARHIFEKLPQQDKRLLSLSLDQRLDGSGNLYLRLDKQKAYRGELAVYDGDDVIRVIIGLAGRDREEALRRLGVKD